MIKATAKTGDGRDVLFIGLSRMNADRLVQGRAIAFDTQEMGMKGGPEVVIMGGETEEAMRQAVERHGLITPDTKVRNLRGEDKPATPKARTVGEYLTDSMVDLVRAILPQLSQGETPFMAGSLTVPITDPVDADVNVWMIIGIGPGLDEAMKALSDKHGMNVAVYDPEKAGDA